MLESRKDIENRPKTDDVATENTPDSANLEPQPEDDLPF
jgi:hypothetical protein